MKRLLHCNNLDEIMTRQYETVTSSLHSSILQSRLVMMGIRVVHVHVHVCAFMYIQYICASEMKAFGLICMQ